VRVVHGSAVDQRDHALVGAREHDHRGTIGKAGVRLRQSADRQLPPGLIEAGNLRELVVVPATIGVAEEVDGDVFECG
jgi:hypothetical protein